MFILRWKFDEAARQRLGKLKHVFSKFDVIFACVIFGNHAMTFDAILTKSA